MLQTDAKNRMLNVLKGYMDRLYVLSSGAIVDNPISNYTANFVGYTGSGGRYVPMSWGVASNGSVVSANSPSSNPIMFAMQQGTSIGSIVYVDASTGNVIATFSTNISISGSDKPFYIVSETFSIV